MTQRALWLAGLGASVLLLSGFLSGFHAEAAGPDGVSLHGFGTWAYGNTDGNVYLSGNDKGDYDNLSLSLNVTAEIRDDVTAVSQLFWNETGEDEVETDIDFAFVRWVLLDELELHIGRLKQPFGNYAEIFDVGTARPFLQLPQGIYGPSGMVSEGVNGVGVSGSRYTAGGWGMRYDLAGGEVEADLTQPWERPVDDESDSEAHMDVHNAVAGRITFLPPIAGLDFGVSTLVGHADEASSGDGTDYQTFGIHLEYLSDRWLVRSEIARMDIEDHHTADAAYVEAACMITDHWQAALGFDWTKVDPVETGFEAGSLTEHTAWSAGINYWVDPGVVLKLSGHLVDGNRFALPEDFPPAPDAGEPELDRTTALVQFGVQFSF